MGEDCLFSCLIRFIDGVNESKFRVIMFKRKLFEFEFDFLFVTSDFPVIRKIEKHREKVLRCDSVLKKNPFVQTVSSSKPKLKRSKKTIVVEDKTRKQVQKVRVI